MGFANLQVAGYETEDSRAMQHQMHPLIQLVPDWMIGGVLKTMSWAAAGSGVILGVVAETPASLVATVICSITGVGIAVINWAAAKERSRIKTAELESRAAAQEAKIIAQDAEIAVLKSHITVLSASTTSASGSHVHMVMTSPTADQGAATKPEDDDEVTLD